MPIIRMYESSQSVVHVAHYLHITTKMSNRIFLQLIYSEIKSVRENLRVLLKQLILMEGEGEWVGVLDLNRLTVDANKYPNI